MKKELTVGIDLGTYNSSIASLDDIGRPEVIPNAEGSRATRSVVTFTDTETLVGEEADNAANIFPSVSEVKRLMGKVDSDNKPTHCFTDLEGAAWRPQEISGLILKKLITDCKTHTGMMVSKAVVSVPAYFDDAARKATKEAGALAGVDVLALVDEPVAAAIAYQAHNTLPDGSKIGVYDIGGGTFDIAVVEIRDGNAVVLTTEGDRRLGGADFDMQIIAEIKEQGIKQLHVNIDDLTDDLALSHQLKDVARKTKHTLTTRTKTTINIHIQGQQLSFQYTRKQFEAAISPFIAKTIEITDSCLKSKNLTPADLHCVVLVGGSTRVPLVKQQLKAFTGKEPLQNTDPDLIVAQGAALAAAILTKQQGNTVNSIEGNEVKCLPATDFKTVTAHALGVAAYDNNMTQEGFSVIIPAQSPIPTVKSESFSMVSEQQTSVLARVFQGTAGNKLSDCTYIGDVQLTDLPSGPLDKQRIAVAYEYDRSGIIHVVLTDSVSGKSNKGEIRHETGMSDKELQNAMKLIHEHSGEVF